MAGTKQFDLIVVGAGSGNSIAGDAFADQSVAIIERWTFGGTCLNRGCIPSKMYVIAAHAAQVVREARLFDLSATFHGANWPAIREHVFGRIDPIAESGLKYRRSLQNTTVFSADATFVDERVLQVGEQRITAPNIVLAVGSRPYIPDIPGLDTIEYHTSDTIMRLDELPGSMVILGGGYVACEMAHVFAAFGTKVTLANRSAALLPSEDQLIRESFTEQFGQRLDVRVHTMATNVARNGSGVTVTLEGKGAPTEVHADVLLVATGRHRNGDQLDVEATGLVCDPGGRIAVDEFQRTKVSGVWALGDVSSPYLLKHVANHEARVVANNLLHPEKLIATNHHAVPHGVFTSPEVAAVGLTEAQALAEGIEVNVAVKPYSDTAYGWGLRDTTSFVKVVVTSDGSELLGAHIVGPQATTLLQPFVQAMALGSSPADVANNVYYPHPALSEVIEQALLDVTRKNP